MFVANAYENQEEEGRGGKKVERNKRKEGRRDDGRKSRGREWKKVRAAKKVRKRW